MNYHDQSHTKRRSKSNFSLTGFNSALFLASEFSQKSMTEVYIPINDLSQKNKKEESRRFSTPEAICNYNLYIKSKKNKKNKEDYDNSYSPTQNIRENIEEGIYNHNKDSHNLINGLLSSNCIYNNKSYRILDNEHCKNQVNSSNQITNMSKKFKLQSSQSSNDNKLITNQSSQEKSFERTKNNDNPNNQISISNNDLIVMNNLIKSSIEKSNQEYKSKKNQKSSKKLDWTCPVCQNLNYSFRGNCNLCSYIKN